MKQYVRHIILSFFALIAISHASAQDFSSSTLPIIVINTCNDSINNENPVRAKMKIIYHEDGRINQLSDTRRNNINYTHSTLLTKTIMSAYLDFHPKMTGY